MENKHPYSPSQAPSAPQAQQPSHPQAQQSGYPQAQQPGYSQAQQPGYPQAQQPGYPQAQQPGYSQTQQPGYPQVQQPDYPQAQQPGYSQAQQPDYPQAQQPGYPQPQQPGYPQAQQPGYPQAQQPGYPQPQQPGYPQAQQPGYPQDQQQVASPHLDYQEPPQPPPLDIRQVKQSFSICALSVFGLMAVGILFAGIGEFSMPYGTISNELRSFLIYAFMYIPGLPVMMRIAKKAPAPLQPLPARKSISFKTMLKVVLINNSVLVLMMIFSAVMPASAQAPPDTGYIASVNADPLTGFFSLVIFAPLIEEFVIRRNFYPHLYQYGARIFVIFSTIIFSFMHLNSGQLLTTLPMGTLAGLLMYYSGNFKYAVILHALSNLASYLLFASVGNSDSLTLYLLIQAPLMLIGFIVAIVWWLKELRHKQLAPAQIGPNPGFSITKAAFLNKGTIICLLAFSLMILFNMQ